MGTSEKPVISVKTPISWERMTDRQRTRLSRIVSRDTRVIKAYLGVIERHESELFVGKRRKRINPKKLKHLTLTATRGDANRTAVPHDFKARFQNISVNELHECCDTARAMWDSYLANKGARPLQSESHRSKKIPRLIFHNRFEIVYTPHLEIKHWLRLRDSLDSVREGRRIHDQLMIPLSPSSYHLNKLESGDVKSLRILRDQDQKWWAVFSVRLEIDEITMQSRPQAVMGIDLGVKKAVCSVILTHDKITQVRCWDQEEKVSRIEELDNQVASLQQKRNALQNRGLDPSGVKKRLREIRNLRENVSLDHDRKLVRRLASHIIEMSLRYNLYVAIGRVRGIRNAARKGNYKGPTYRGMVHRWSFFRITELLKHKLSTEGFDERRVFAVPEAWTSITCHKCGHKGLRPKQSYFLCHTCGYRDNADKNAAINIGRRLIKLIPSLRDERGLGRWLQYSTETTPKTRRSSGSEGMSPLPERLPASLERKSVADCDDQTSPEGSRSSTDPAMAKTVETLTAAGEQGIPCTNRQRKEATSRERSNAPMTASKGHVRAHCNSSALAGDSGRDKGGTQKSMEEGWPSSSWFGSEGIRSGLQISVSSTMYAINQPCWSEVVTRYQSKCSFPNRSGPAGRW
jgi:transposase